MYIAKLSPLGRLPQQRLSWTATRPPRSRPGPGSEAPEDGEPRQVVPWTPKAIMFWQVLESIFVDGLPKPSFFM